jgi:hypothetical protein
VWAAAERALTTAGKENRGRMMTILQVIGQMSEHGLSVQGHEHPLFALGPEQQVSVLRAQRQIGRVADSGYVKDIDSRRVVPLQSVPEDPAQILVEHEA